MKKYIAVGPMMIVRENVKTEVGGFEIANTGKFRSGIVVSASDELTELNLVKENQEIVYPIESAFQLGLGNDPQLMVVDFDQIVAFVVDEEEIAN